MHALRIKDNLHTERERRFADFVTLEEVISFMMFPFKENINAASVSIKLGLLIDDDSVVIKEKIIKLRDIL